MRILVTGGAGFIGSHLIDRLMAQKHEVICLDNFYTGTKRNIEKWLGHPYFELIRHDITEPIRLEVDQVYHLACPASPVHYQFNPVKTIKTNVMGTMNMLGLAKRIKARFLIASTSEVYGDPDVHPQTEEYRGNVNCIGPRSCYDEGKRVAETLCFDYHRQNNVDIRVARIFNSLTGDQKVLYYKGDHLYYETFAECYDRIHQDISDVSVPCFDQNSQTVIKPISAVWKHHVTKRGYRIKTTWGKQVKITEDHSLFTRDVNGNPQAIFGHNLQVGDLIAVPQKIAFIEKALTPFYLTDKLASKGWAIVSDRVIEYLEKMGDQIRAYLDKKGVAPVDFYAHIKEYEATNRMPLDLWQYLELPLTPKDKIALENGEKTINNWIENSDDFLWLLGSYLGAVHVGNQGDGSETQVCWNVSDETSEKLVKIIDQLFGLKCHRDTSGVKVQSNILSDVLINILGAHQTADIPNWIIQLPNEQLVNFIHGFWSSQNHQEKATNSNSMIWHHSNQQIIEKICLILAKFGLISNVTESEITTANPSKSYQITIPDLEQNQSLDLAHLTQKLEGHITGDMAWAKVTEIEEFPIDDYVYDFSVPEHENFIGGTYSIYCHNTYGPRMLENDGRVVSNFVVQALRGIPLTVYGEGSQTRSFCYVSDLVEGLIRLMNGNFIGPVNLGNPGEYTILELAQKVQQMVNPGAEIIFKPLPQDDPKQRQPDITRAKTHLGWEPTIPLAEGLELTINDFRERMDNI